MMDYEKVTENLVRRAMEEHQLQEEYQVFLDFMLQSLDLDNYTKEDSRDKRIRELIDSTIKL
jgi:hypothetical protein